MPENALAPVYKKWYDTENGFSFRPSSKRGKGTHIPLLRFVLYTDWEVRNMRKLFIFLLLFFLFAPAAAGTTVIIDPGHGSPDGGTVGLSGIPEKDYTIAIARDLDAFLGFMGIPRVLTRETDSGVYDGDALTIRQKKVSDLQNRLKLSLETEDPVFLSIHMNASPVSSAAGFQIFYAPSEGSYALGEKMNAVFSSSLPRTRIRPLSPAPKAVFLMRKLSCPALLMEYGYLSNPGESAKLDRASYRKKLAFLTACGLYTYLTNEG